MVMTLLTRPKKTVATIVVATDGSGDFNCDGTADEVEINAALNSLPATGGCIYIKEGIYNITATINITTANTGLIGCGRATIFNFTGGLGIAIGNVSNVIIQQLSFTGIAGLGFIYTSAGAPTEVTIRDNYFYDSIGEGVVISHGRFLVESNYFYNVGNFASLNATVYFGATNGILSNNIFIDCPSYGIAIHSTANQNKISNNILSGCGRNAINVLGDECIIVNNLCLNGDENGIELDVLSGCIVNGNICNANVKNGIKLYRSSNCSITGNNCMDNDSGDTASFDGIAIDNTCNYNLISSNRCGENDRDEIRIDDNTCDRNIIIGNNCYGTTHTATIVDNGTNTQIFNNIET